MPSIVPYESEASLRSRSRDEKPTGIVVDKSCRVYIGHIPTRLIEKYGADALRAEFEAFGPVESYRLFTEKTGRFIGSALCTYQNPADAALALKVMADQEIDGEPLQVAPAKDHGVILFHQNRLHGTREDRSHFYRSGKDRSGEDRWTHDKFEQLAEGKDMEEVLGFRRRSNTRGRGGRGRGQGRGRGFSKPEDVEAAFEKYIAERDKAQQEEEAKLDSPA